jgi:hypothetical protein
MSQKDLWITKTMIRIIKKKQKIKDGERDKQHYKELKIIVRKKSQVQDWKYTGRNTKIP